MFVLGLVPQRFLLQQIRCCKLGAKLFLASIYKSWSILKERSYFPLGARRTFILALKGNGGLPLIKLGFHLLKKFKRYHIRDYLIESCKTIKKHYKPNLAKKTIDPMKHGEENLTGNNKEPIVDKCPVSKCPTTRSIISFLENYFMKNEWQR